MKMAKASPADIENAMAVCGALDALANSQLPTQWLDHEEDDDWFSERDDLEAAAALRNLLKMTDTSGLFRVVTGMAVLLDPVNRIVDQDQDALEIHPRFSAMLALSEEQNAVIKALRDLFSPSGHHEFANMVASVDDLIERTNATIANAKGA